MPANRSINAILIEKELIDEGSGILIPVYYQVKYFDCIGCKNYINCGYPGVEGCELFIPNGGECIITKTRVQNL